MIEKLHSLGIYKCFINVNNTPLKLASELDPWDFLKLRIQKAKFNFAILAPHLQDCLEVERFAHFLRTVVKSQAAFEPVSVLTRVSWSKVNEAAILGEGGTLHLENITRYKTSN
jgi:hypothetical protein